MAIIEGTPTPPSPSLKDEKHAQETTEEVLVRNMFTNAASATDKEHKMSLWQGIKLYPKAVGWSMLISLCIAMEGFDLCLLGTFYAMPQFNRQFGEQLPD
ncbi:MAG: hypothetical protein M1823_006630, partial [Watsoniomyces obsoletus]